MKEADYDKLFRELLGSFPEEDDQKAREELDEMTADDLDRLVPIIDEMCRQAENRGRFQTYLEVAEAERIKANERRTREFQIGTTGRVAFAGD